MGTTGDTQSGTTTGTTRRRVLAGAALSGAAAVTAGALPARVAHAAQDDSLAPFPHGVASGDPTPEAVVLWTRLDPSGYAASDAGLPVGLVVARDPALSDVVLSRDDLVATADRDWCVKVDPTGLAPSTTYYYRFTAPDGRRSLTGRTRTAPAAGTATCRFAVVSCSNYPAGFFTVYRKVAERDDLDAVLHLGDYLYEGAGPDTGDRVVAPRGETVALEDYRQRYATYRLDPDLRRCHAQHPFVVTWDDHESTNDSWYGGADNHSPATEGDWFERKAASARAYDEWLPIRLPDQAGRRFEDGTRIYRALAYGDLADVLVLDTRLEGRDQQVPPAVADTAGVVSPEADDPARTLLGAAQEAWLRDRLGASQARGARWRLVAQQVMLGQWNVVGLPDTESFRFVRSGGVAFNPDQWDGYTASRDRFFDVLRGATPAGPVSDVVVLTGDIHTSWAMDLSPDPYDPLVYDPVTGAGSLAVEMVTPSVTSSGFEEIGEPGVTAAEQSQQVTNPHMKYVDLDRKGYVVLTVSAQEVQGDWWYVDTITEPTSGEQLGTSWKTLAGEGHLRQADGAAAPGPAAAPAPDGEEPEPVVPEVRLPALLAVGAAAVGGAAVLRRRGQDGTAAG